MASYADVHTYTHTVHRLVGLVVKASTSRAADPRFDDLFSLGIFLGQVIIVTLPGAWGYEVGVEGGSAPGMTGAVSVYCDWMKMIDGLVCSFNLSVAARSFV